MKSCFLRRVAALLLALALACSLLIVPAAADDPEEGGETPSVPDPISVTLDQDDVKLYLGRDQTVTLTATVTGDPSDNAVDWLIGPTNSEIIMISPSGNTCTVRLTDKAKAEDTVVVYARSKTDTTKDARCVIAVVEPPAPAVNLVTITDPANDDLYRYVNPNSTITLHAIASPVDAPAAARRITWESSDKSIATVDPDGVITGKYPGKATITAWSGGNDPQSDSRDIEVSGILLRYVKKSPSGGQGTTIDLTERSVEDIYQHRDIVVMYTTYGYAKQKTINWESSNASVATVDTVGRVTAYSPGEATITASVAGTNYTARFRVRVSEDTADAISVNMGTSPTYSFSDLLRELNSRSQSMTEAPLDSIYNLKVSTENGVLYYRYTSSNNSGHGVGGTERYYYQAAAAGQMAIRDVTFVPLPGFGGTAVVDYTAAATSGATFTGTIRIQATASGDVNYSTGAGQPVGMSSAHFSDVCRGRTGRAIGYVTFTQPAASRGTLYYNYSSSSGQFSSQVDSSTRYYANGSPSIDNVTFVPAAGYTGDVSIPYRCTDSSGATYSGAVTVTVSGGGSGTGSSGGTGSGTSGTRYVEYYSRQNQTVVFSAADFNDACLRSTGYSLNRIRFDSLPSSAAGTLYLDDDDDSSTRVAAGRFYYRSYTPHISNISFVPARDYSGTVSIPFTGYDSTGGTFSGTVMITVGYGYGYNYGSRYISYSVAANRSVRFSSSDFNSACRSATGDTLDHIRFHTVSTGYGTLYHQYSSANQTGASVSTGTNYYYTGSTRLIGNISFAAGSVSGTTVLDYTGYSVGGYSFSGTVEIQVTGGSTVVSGGGIAGSGVTVTAPAASGSTIRYTGSSTPIQFRASDFQSVCQALMGAPLSSVQFTVLPNTGRLYQNYGTSFRTDVTPVANYSIEALGQISYVPRAEYQGTVTIPYTGYDTRGAFHSGAVEIQVSNSYCATPFVDVAYGWDWAKPSIEYLRYSGITSGYQDGTFRPGQSISRGEFTLMLCRAFQFPTTGSSGFSDVPASSAYAGAVASARRLGIVQGENGRFRPDQPITRQSAMTMLCRAMAAAGQTVPAVDTSLLSSYVDGAQVSAFARSSVASLVQMGIVRGNSSMLLNPAASINRAEMAVILHRVLTR